MTKGLFQDVKRQLGKEERFLRIALIVISAIVIALDVFMFIYNVWPNNILMLLMLVPILISVVFAWQGKPTQAVWLFSVSLWVGMIAEAAAAPQSPLDLVGVRQYLFPLMLVAFVGIFGLQKGKARTSNVLGSIVVTLISALIGYYADKSEASAVSPEMVWVVNVLVILAALGLIYLVIVNFQRGLLILRGSVSLKTGIGFFAFALITLGFILFTLNTDRRMAEIYDYTLYVDTEQIIISEVFAEIQAMRLDLSEYLTSADGANSNDAYMQHMVEYQEGSENVKLLLSDLATLQEEGMGTYTPDSRDFTIEFTASIINVIGYSDSRVSQIITVIDERGNENSGLAGELNRAKRDLDNLAVFGEIPELELLLLKMRQSEMAWASQHDLADTEVFNNFGEGALSLLKGLEISVNQRILAEQALNAYIDNFNQVVELDKQISELSSEITRAIEPLTPKLEELIAASHTRGEEAQGMLAEADAGTQQASIFFGIAAFVIAAVIAVLTTRTIVRPILQLTETATEFSEGNMMARAALTSKDETGRLAGVFNQMAERLQKSLLNLEQTIVERTTELQERAREMEASQRVTFAASERTTPEDFLDLLVNLITDQFDVYHCQVYLVDEEKNAAVLSQSTGYAGRQLLQRGHAIPLDAQSLVTQCINTGESVLVAETTKDANWLPNPLLPLTQSELVVPLKIDDKVIGAMDIQDRVPNRFMEASLPVFESMTEQVAFLYQNNELLEEIAEAQRVQQQFVTQLETTSEVAGQLTTILDPTQLLDQAVTMLQSRFNFYHAHIYLLDEVKQNLAVAAGSGHVGVILKDRGHSIPVDAERSFVARAFREAAPVRVVDTTKDANWLPNPLLPDTRAEMAVPLVTRGQVIGVLDIQDEVVDRFTEVDEDTMLTLAGQLATSVDTARLFVNVEAAAERDRTRFDIAEALSGNPTEEEVWDILLKKAMDDNVVVTLSLAEFTEDGGVKTVSHRSASSTPGLVAPPVGTTMVIPNDPNYKILDFSEVFISNDVENDERIRPESRQGITSRGVVSMLTTPITISDDGDWQGGVIRVGSSQPDFFGPNKESKYRTLIELGAVALRAARLRASIDQAARRTATRLEVTQAMAGNLTEDEVLDVLVEKAALYPEARIAVYYEDLDSDVRTIVSQRDEVYDTGMVPMGVGTRISNDMMKFEDVLLQDQIVVVDNVLADERLDENTKNAMRGVGYTSMATFPLQMSEDWIGYIFVTSKVEKTFDEEKISLYNILAEAGTVALRAARLRDAVGRAAERDRKRFEVAEALSGHLNEEQVWDVLLEQAMGENLMIVMNRTEYLEDGTMVSITQRSASSSPSLTPAPRGNRINISLSPGYEAMLRGEVFISDSIENDERLDSNVREFLMGAGSESLMAAPLSAPDDDVLLGFMSLVSPVPGYFNSDVRLMYEDLVELGTTALRAARLRAEADQERERFRVLIENAPEAIVVFNGENGEFMEANQNAVDLYEIPMEELIGNNPVALSPEIQSDGRPSAEAAMSYIQEAIDGGTPVFDWVHRTGKGREIPCEIRLVRLPGYDNPPRLRGSITDISERAAAQQAIVQGDRLKSEFLANMSHELRTPLNSILGYTDVLLMGLDGELDEEVTTDLEAIHENSQHLLNLINDILDLAKIEAGRMTIELGEVNVSHLLHEVKKTSAGLLVGKDVEMVVDADEELPLMHADYHRVYQVVNNLVSNAVKFTEKGSITLRAVNEGDQMVLQVEDTGIGISKDDLDIIFEEFTQADTSSTRQHEGTGLGLTITRRLVQMHGGMIGVESEVGKGATFTARFPLQAKVNPEQLMIVQSSNGNK